MTLAALALLGDIGARLGGAPPLRAMLRVLAWGAVAMAVTAGIGALVGTSEARAGRPRRAVECARATYSSKRPAGSRLRSYRLASGNGGNQDSRRTIQLS